MKKIFKKLLWATLAIVTVCAAMMLLCNQIIENNAKDKVYSELDSIRPAPCGLLLGTTPQTRIGRRRNFFFKNRIDATERLYKSGKIKTILISGDENSLDGVNEVECMRDSLVARGVPVDDILLDGKGLRTLDAVVRAVTVYDQHSFVVISQRFHNERAIYLAEHLGLDVHNLSGYNAADPTSKTSLLIYFREYFARVKVFIDLLTGRKAQTYENDQTTLQQMRNRNKYIERIDTMGLIVLYPQFKTVDLVCGTMPPKDDNQVILVAEAAYTGDYLDEFKHTNIAGNHVSGGTLHKGYTCRRNTGAFVYYNGAWKFCQGNYTQEMQAAAQHGGCAFGQELMIHQGKMLKTGRADDNENQFRALCDCGGRLCIIESSGFVPFGRFKKALLQYGATEAIYLDMGSGWNHAWYRDNDSIVELHPWAHSYCTNWITFYR